MNRKNLIFAAVLCMALAFGFSACENPNNDDLLNQIEDLKNELNDLKNDKDKTDSADKDSDKDNSSDNEQSGGSSEENAGGSGEGTPDPDEGEEGGDEGGSSSSTAVPPTCTDYVDLGLSVKWATCNVGATKPEEYGNYYAWGEVEPKEVYDWSTYKFMDSSVNDWTGINKYTVADRQTSGVWYDNSGNFIGDNKTVLDKEDDAAFVNMGGSWRMPTFEEQTELQTECTWTWTTLNDVNGYNVEGPNGNSIFIPAAGFRRSSGLNYAGSEGGYWSSSLYTGSSDDACNLYFDSSYVYWSNFYRYYGLSVRGVFSR